MVVARLLSGTFGFFLVLLSDASSVVVL